MALLLVRHPRWLRPSIRRPSHLDCDLGMPYVAVPANGLHSRAISHSVHLHLPRLLLDRSTLECVLHRWASVQGRITSFLGRVVPVPHLPIFKVSIRLRIIKLERRAVQISIHSTIEAAVYSSVS